MTYDEKKLTSKMLLDTLKTRGIFDSAKAVTNDQYIFTPMLQKPARSFTRQWLEPL
jgi:hypothetical protein